MNLPQDDPELASRLSAVEGSPAEYIAGLALDLDYQRYRLREAAQALQKTLSEVAVDVMMGQIQIDRWIAELEKK